MAIPRRWVHNPAMPVMHPPARRLISPVREPATTPPALAGEWAPIDRRLDDAILLPLPGGRGPEDVAVDAAGRVVAGDEEGVIWRWPTDADEHARPERLAQTNGRPLGIEFDPSDGSLIVCDAYRG